MARSGGYTFKFKTPVSLRFGTGESDRLGEEIRDLGYGKIAAIIDQGVFSHTQTKKAVDGIKGLNLLLDIYKNETAEPTYDYLESFRGLMAAKNYDCLVGIGGGSTIDLAKGTAVLLANEGPAISFRGFPELKNKPLPVIAIPTTAGSGSEATYNAVFTDTKENRKLGINSILNFPVCAIIDPLFTLDCPKFVTISSGADALIHSLESYAHRDHTPMSRMYSREAFRLVYNNLAKILGNPHNIAIRSNLALGAYLAGTALVNAGSGPVGALSYPLGVLYKVPHGDAGAVFLSAIIRMNIEKGYKDYGELYDLMEDADRSLPHEEKSAGFMRNIQNLMNQIGVPRGLGHYRVGEDGIEKLVKEYDNLKKAIDQNPKEITKDDIRSLITALAVGGKHARI